MQTFSEILNLRLLWANKGLNLRLSNPDNQQTRYFGPRYRHYVGFGGILWNIGFNVLLPLPQSWQTDEIKRFDFQGSFIAKRWLIDGIYQRYQGFYQGETGQRLSEDPAAYRDGLLARKLRATLTYVPGGDRVSLRAPYNQGARQRKTAGSPLLTGGFSYVKLANQDRILLLDTLSGDTLRQSRVYALTGMLGYTTTLVHRRFFLFLFGSAGLNFQQKRQQYAREERVFAIETTYDLRASLGYDDGKFFTGVSGSLDYTQFDVRFWNFEQITSQLRAFVGLRLTEPLFLQKRKPKFLEKLKNIPNIPLPPIFG